MSRRLGEEQAASWAEKEDRYIDVDTERIERITLLV
jgi:hypothetical protein